MARSSMNLKDYSIEQLEKLFAQVEKEKDRRTKDVKAAKQKILSMMKEFGISVADFADAEMKKSTPAPKKASRKKAKRKSTRKAAPAAAKAAPVKRAKAPKKATAKKAPAKKTATKKTRKKVAPKYANPEDKSMKWTGRGRQPLWVVAALKSGKTMDDLKI